VDDRFNRPAWSVAWHLFGLPAQLRRAGVEVLYLPAGNRRLAPLARTPTVAVVHDLSAFHVRAKYDPARMLYIRRVLPWMMRRIDRVIAVSGSTARDVVELAGVAADRVTVVGLGYDREVFHPRDPAVCRRRLVDAGLELPGQYLVYVSRLEHPGKNHVGLVRGFARAVERDPGMTADLVLAGGRWPGSEVIDREIETLGLGSRVRLLGFVADAVLPDLLGASTGLVFPSLFEGFGLPILEAQAAGVPVACANTSSLPEVAGGAALLFDPGDPDAIADAIARLASDGAMRASLRTRGLANASRFSWEQTADATLELLEATAGDR
jgi:glycosyltransferase involved in cell wall biosynthesis